MVHNGNTANSSWIIICFISRSAEHELYISSEHQTLCGQTLLSILQQPFAVNSADLTFNKVNFAFQNMHCFFLSRINLIDVNSSFLSLLCLLCCEYFKIILFICVVFLWLAYCTVIIIFSFFLAVMFVRLSVCVRRACIVIIRCRLEQIEVYGWIVRCSGCSDTKACPPTLSRLFPLPPGSEVGYGCAN